MSSGIFSLIHGIRHPTSDIVRTELRPDNAGAVGSYPHRHVHATVNARVACQHFDMTMQPADAGAISRVERHLEREP